MGPPQRSVLGVLQSTASHVGQRPPHLAGEALGHQLITSSEDPGQVFIASENAIEAQQGDPILFPRGILLPTVGIASPNEAPLGAPFSPLAGREADEINVHAQWIVSLTMTMGLAPPVEKGIRGRTYLVDLVWGMRIQHTCNSRLLVELLSPPRPRVGQPE